MRTRLNFCGTRLDPLRTRLSFRGTRLDPPWTRLSFCGTRLDPPWTRLSSCGTRLDPPRTRLSSCGTRLGPSQAHLNDVMCPRAGDTRAQEHEHTRGACRRAYVLMSSPATQTITHVSKRRSARVIPFSKNLAKRRSALVKFNRNWAGQPSSSWCLTPFWANTCYMPHATECLG